MKIGLISPYDWAVPGGVNAHILQLARQFEERGHTVRIMAPTSDESPPDAPTLIFIGRSRSIRASG